MNPIRTAVVGAGFVGRVHLEALRRLGTVEIAALADPRIENARQLAADFRIPLADADYRRILDDPGLDAVHLCVPNALHFPIASDALQAGKHVLCEKPLATCSQAASQLAALACRTGRRNCTCYNLRYYPMVQQMRRMCEAGDLGEILAVQGTYSQDWLLYDTDWNWRLESRENGPSRAMADIGSHWCDMAEHITGLRITALCADLQTFHPVRRRPSGPVETFAGKLPGPGDYIESAVDTEDFGAMLFRMGPRTRGSLTASQVAAGRKNRLFIEVFGQKSSVAWDQEHPNELWIGSRDYANQIMVKDPSLMHPGARGYSDLPGGHAEGYHDTFKQLFRRFYASVEDPNLQPEYPQFAEGARQLRLVEAQLASSRQQGWVEVAC